jgi:uncharacterized membrane protein YkoI
MRKALVLSTLAAVLASSVPVFADDYRGRLNVPRDQERARQALIEGRIRPLTEITKMFRQQMAGEILGVELDVEGANTFVYEFKILTPQGKLKEVDVDAKTGRILKIEDD